MLIPLPGLPEQIANAFDELFADKIATTKFACAKARQALGWPARADPTLEKRKISAGGEAIILNETFGNLDVAVRVQCFDPALFTEEFPAASNTERVIKNSDELHFEIHLSEGNLVN